MGRAFFSRRGEDEFSLSLCKLCLVSRDSTAGNDLYGFSRFVSAHHRPIIHGPRNSIWNRDPSTNFTPSRRNAPQFFSKLCRRYYRPFVHDSRSLSPTSVIPGVLRPPLCSGKTRGTSSYFLLERGNDDQPASKLSPRNSLFPR